MAPSNVFSKFRPHHKRSGSNPTSPDTAATGSVAQISNVQSPDFIPPPARLANESNIASTSPISSFAPTLPPIARVSSIYDSSTRQKRRKEVAAETHYLGHAKTDKPVQQSAIVQPRVEENRQAHPAYKEEKGNLHVDVGQMGIDKPVPKHVFSDAVRDLMRKDANTSSTGGYKMQNQMLSGLGLSINGDPLVTTTSGDAVRPSNSPLQSSPAVIATEKRLVEKYSSASRYSVTGRFSASTENLSTQKTKNKLTLLNPMSLWSRRRSGQSIDTLSSESLNTYRNPYVPAMADDYDPRIRGKGVHDFSAPRTRRVVTHDGVGSAVALSTQTSGTSSDRPDSSGDYFDARRKASDTSPSKIEREHTPVFKEHFDDDDDSGRSSAAAIRAEQLVNKDFLARAMATPPAPDREPPAIPTLPNFSQPQLVVRRSLPPPADLSIGTSTEFPGLSPVAEASPLPGSEMWDKTSTKAPPNSRSRATSVVDPSWQPAGLPQHMSSIASRFSFQIAGTDSDAQEKLLEERHKQKAASKVHEDGGQAQEDDDDYFDEDAMYDPEGMDDLDGFDEEIPTIGDDVDYGYSISPSMNTFNFASINTPLNPVHASPLNQHGTLETSLDAEGNKIGYALSEYPPANDQYLVENDRLRENTDFLHGDQLLDGVDASQEFNSVADFTTDSLGISHPTSVPVSDVKPDDELYFDDGLIEVPDDLDDADRFDESLLDDPSGPFYERKVRFSDATAQEGNEPAIDHDTNLAPQTSVIDQQRQSSDNTMGQDFLTPSDFKTLNAYHGALADAATKAAESGRFNRKDSVDAVNFPPSVSPDLAPSDTESSGPSLIPDDGRFSQATSTFSPSGLGYGGFPVEDDYYTSDFDDLEDDPIIAAANAEALANDYEGEYGREFGFWANADPKGDAVFTNGGYFGAREIILGRSQSGRNAMREPNLTPITERSEISARNSFISFTGQFGPLPGSAPIQSPGLAQLARMSPYGFGEDDPEISLERLMKLRGKAFGSSASLASGGSSPRNQSPVQFFHNRSSMNADVNAWDEGFTGPLSDEANLSHARSLESIGTDDSDALDAVNAVSGDYEDMDGYAEEDERFSSSSDMDHEEERTITASSHPAFQQVGHGDVPDVPEVPLMPPPPRPQRDQSLSILATASMPPPPLPSASKSPSNSRVTSPLSPVSPFASAKSPLSPQQQQSLRSPLHIQTHFPAQHQANNGWFNRPTSGSFSPSAAPNSAGTYSHSRKGSAADSVTYVREQDEVTGKDRWILERRRTAESGELELIGREIVEGGRI